MLRMPIQYLALWAFIVLAGCAVTTAPTESSTETFDKTTNATSDMTSSTSPGSGNSTAQAEHFTRTHFVAVRREMAVGEGEHLRALGQLLGVAEPDGAAFNDMAKARYPELFASPGPSPEEVVAELRHNLADQPWFYN